MTFGHPHLCGRTHFRDFKPAAPLCAICALKNHMERMCSVLKNHMDRMCSVLKNHMRRTCPKHIHTSLRHFQAM